MKKITVVFLAMAMLLLSGIIVFAEEATDDTGEWSFDAYGDGVVLTAYHGDQTDVYVPNKIEVNGESMSVLKLGENLFSGATINSATLGEGITEIGEGAFSNNTNIVCIVTPESLTTIGANAFSGCTAFNSIILYDAVTSIGENAFSDCESLTIYCNENTVGYNYAVANAIDYEILNPDATPEIVTLDGIEYYIMNGEAIAVSFDGSSTDVVVPSNVNGYPVTELRKAFSSNKNLESVKLPDSILVIGSGAFANCTNLRQINIPNTVKSLESSAFSNCSALIDISLPESVTAIKAYAFSMCSSLKNVVIPYGIKEIGNCAFQECYSLAEVKIPGSVEKIGSHVFTSCTDLEKVTLSSGLKTIGEYAFSRTDLNEIVIPDSVQRIGYGAFFNCWYLEKVKLSNGITTIENRLFSGCWNLTDVMIPEGVTKIEEEAFNNCNSLEDIKFPETVTKIGSSAFVACSSITSVDLPDALIEIGESAFDNTSLSFVELPSTLQLMYKNSFRENVILGVIDGSYAYEYSVENDLLYFVMAENISPEMYLHEGITYYILNENAIAINADSTLTEVVIPEKVNGYTVISLRGTFRYHENLTSINISNGVTEIGNNTFAGCAKLSNVIMADSITVIGDCAFWSCGNIENINMPQNLKHIGESAFEFCLKLTCVTLPEKVEYIGGKAFASCGVLAEINIPGGITTINEQTFLYCENLKKITIHGGVITIGNGAFLHCKNLIEVIFSEGLEVIERNAFIGCESLEKIVLPVSVKKMYEVFPEQTVIGVYENTYAHSFVETTDYAYVSLKEGISDITLYTVDGVKYVVTDTEAAAVRAEKTLSDVIIPSYIEGKPVTKLQGTFKYHTNLKSVKLPDTVTYIGNYTFSNCKLSSIEIPYGVTYIGAYAFSFCQKLTAIEIPDSVTFIGEYAFDSCGSLAMVKLSKNLTSIEAHTFDSCGISAIEIPEGVKSIGENAFEYCKKLEKAIIPNTVKKIGFYAFVGCEKLTCVVMSQKVYSIGDAAFSGCPLIKVNIPSSVEGMGMSSFSVNTILMVYENSYAHKFAINNNLLYFVLHKIDNPEINYGTGISGTVTDTEGNAIAGATVEALYDDGMIKESVVTDENGAYAFTYAEVGRYTIRATDTNGNTASELVSVKRMNVFDVFIAGETDIVLKTGYMVSGSISPVGSATVTMKDVDGNVIATVDTADGAFTFENISNGTYVITAENETGSVSKEITVYNGDIVLEGLVISAESAIITGYVEVEDRDFNHHRRNWVHVTLYNSEGVAVASQKTDKDGKYTFTSLPVGDYTIVAETSEMRPDKHHGYDRFHTLTGYAYISITEAKSYEAETIVLYEENDHLVEISGKVTAHGETQNCEVVLKNVFRHEVARMTTGKNGKYTFKNVRDGLYIITATTESDGMGFAIVVVRRGEVFGETDITVYKHSHIREHEDSMGRIPHCNDRDEALKYKDDIRREKEFYDGLSEKEKKQLSKEYVEKLNHNAELISGCTYESTEGKIENGGLIISEDELDGEKTVEIVLNVEKKDAYTKSENGVENSDDYIQHCIEDTAKDRNIVQYYEISLTKNGKAITDVQKHTNSTGKIRVTLDIPEEYRGHKHYSFVHVHNGETTTLVDMDDNPNTVTFEIDRFSTFALSYTDEELTEAVEDAATIVLSEEGNQIKVSSAAAGKLYIANYDGENRMTSVTSYEITAGTTDRLFDFGSNQAAFILDSNLMPLCEKFFIE